MPRLTSMLLGVLAATVTLTTLGCHTAPAGGDGLPADRFLVGGGYEVTYTAPAAGTLVWAERTTRRVFITRSLEAGETFEESADPTDQTFREVLGIDPADARLVLYFVPAAADPGP